MKKIKLMQKKEQTSCELGVVGAVLQRAVGSLADFCPAFCTAELEAGSWGQGRLEKSNTLTLQKGVLFSMAVLYGQAYQLPIETQREL